MIESEQDLAQPIDNSQPGSDAQPSPEPAPIPAPDEPSPTIDFPENVKRLVSFSLTILAVLLYGAILGGAIIRSLSDSSAEFTAGALRATQILSGLVGTVVSAGFARAKRSNLTIISQNARGWLPHWYVQSKLLGLADTIGLNLSGLTASSDMLLLEDEPVRAAKINTATWVAALYSVIYFIIGAAALVITVLRPTVPEIISNNAWVWLGTLISSSYAFFALGESSSAK
ncbi:MAG: hypothetical protein ACYC6L_04030 [Anaerolineae bacterium]